MLGELLRREGLYSSHLTTWRRQRDEGALAAMWLGLEYAICCHYLNPEGRPDVEKFFSVLNSLEGPKPLALRPGETFAYPPKEA